MRFFALFISAFDGGIPGEVISKSELFSLNSADGLTKNPSSSLNDFLHLSS